MMAQLDPSELVSELARRRKLPMAVESEEPPSVRWLRNMMLNLSDIEDRYTVYELLITELKIHGDYAEALECAKSRLTEFDDIVSHIAVAQALLQLGRNPDAIERFKAAFHLAVKREELVNYSFGELMRAAVSVADGRIVADVSEEFLALKTGTSNADCGVETDWMDSAEALGVSREIIAEIRRRAIA